MQKRSAILYLLGSFVMIYLFLHGGFMDDSPGGINHVAQSESIALTQGFMDNHLDFFHPEVSQYTLVDKNVASSGYTADRTDLFPIHNYLPAVWVYSFGGDSGAALKWYNLLWGFIGLYFLFLLALRYTNHVGKSLFVVVFTATLPLFAYFHSSFLPVLPGLACVFIGLYYVYRYSESGYIKYLVWGLVFTIIAALATAEFLPVLLTFMLLYIDLLLPKKKRYLNILLTAIVLLLFVLLAVFLNTKSGFLSHLFDDFLIDPFAPSGFADWKTNYFTVLHAIVFAVALILSLAFFLKKWTHTDILYNIWLRLAILAMILSLDNSTRISHEPYYFLALWGALIPLLFLISIEKLPTTIFERYPKVLYPLLLVLMLALLSETNWTQLVQHVSKEQTDNYKLSTSYDGSDELLAYLGIPKKAKILVAVPKKCGIGNELLMRLDRKGFVWRFKKDNLSDFGKLGMDYLVINRETEDLLRGEYEPLFSLIHLRGSNNTIHVYEVKKPLK